MENSYHEQRHEHAAPVLPDKTHLLAGEDKLGLAQKPGETIHYTMNIPSVTNERPSIFLISEMAGIHLVQPLPRQDTGKLYSKVGPIYPEMLI